MGCGTSTPGAKDSSAAITTESPVFKDALAKTKALFAATDTDHSGELDVTEFVALMGLEPSPYLDRVLTLFDLDDSTLVSFKEFCIGMSMVRICFTRDHQSLAKLMSQKQAAAEFMYQLFDLNNDGQLTKLEIKDAVEESVVVIKDEETLDRKMSPEKRRSLIRAQEKMIELRDDCCEHLDKLHPGKGYITSKEFYALCNRFPQIFAKGEKVYTVMSPYLDPCKIVCEGLNWKPVMKPRVALRNISFGKAGAGKAPQAKHHLTSTGRAALAKQKQREHDIIAAHNESDNKRNKSLHLGELTPNVGLITPTLSSDDIRLKQLDGQIMVENNKARRLRQGYEHDNEAGDAYVFAFDN